MKVIKQSSKFKKDFKKIINDKKKLEALKEILVHLKESGTVPQEYKPHLLVGNYNRCIECHIQSDFLIIWIDETEDVIKLVRLGSHAELF